MRRLGTRNCRQQILDDHRIDPIAISIDGILRAKDVVQ